MRIGEIVRHNGKVGIVVFVLPISKLTCVFGNEVNRHSYAVKPSELRAVDMIDLSDAEMEDVLPLMQSLVFSLVEGNKPF